MTFTSVKVTFSNVFLGGFESNRLHFLTILNVFYLYTQKRIFFLRETQTSAAALRIVQTQNPVGVETDGRPKVKPEIALWNFLSEIFYDEGTKEGPCVSGCAKVCVPLEE